MSNQKTPSQKWEELRKEIISRIAAIDSETPWSESEPKWWLHMQNVNNAASKGITNSE